MIPDLQRWCFNGILSMWTVLACGGSTGDLLVHEQKYLENIFVNTGELLLPMQKMKKKITVKMVPVSNIESIRHMPMGRC